MLTSKHFAYSSDILAGKVDLLIPWCVCVCLRFHTRGNESLWSMFNVNIEGKLRPISPMIFFYFSYLMEIICLNLNINEAIATNFCTCHDSCAVVACAKFCSDLVSWKCIIIRCWEKFAFFWGKIISVMDPRANCLGMERHIPFEMMWTGMLIAYMSDMIQLGFV